MPYLDFEIRTPFLDLQPLDTMSSAPVTMATISVCYVVSGQVNVRAFPNLPDVLIFGCPTVFSGPGDLVQCHSLDEYVEIDQMEDSVRIYVHAILALQTDP